MSRRDSDSKRHHSRFDREPSPKRYRKDGKQEREREGERERDREKERERVTTNGGGRVDRDQRNHLPHHSKQANRDAADDKKSNGHNEKKSNGHNEAYKHSSDSTQPARSHSFYQHDERTSAGQVSQSTGQRETGGKAYTQSREHNEKLETGQSRELRDDKSHSKLDDNLPRRDGFSERKDDQPPTTRRRPAFREKKIPVDSPTSAAKSGHTDHPSERNERKEEKSSNPNHLDRPEKQTADDRLPNRNGGAWRDGFSTRGRYGGSGGNGHYRGREKFHGRQGYQPTATKTRAEKWKHDLYQEVNKDPLPKNEDDQIAKLEALLAS